MRLAAYTVWRDRRGSLLGFLGQAEGRRLPPLSLSTRGGSRPGAVAWRSASRLSVPPNEVHGVNVTAGGHPPVGREVNLLPYKRPQCGYRGLAQGRSAWGPTRFWQCRRRGLTPYPPG